MRADFRCCKCGSIEGHLEVLPEDPECSECGGYMAEIPGSQQGEMSRGMQRDIRELQTEYS